MTIAPEDILNFWFMLVKPEKWFDDDTALDSEVREMFLPAHEAALRGEMKKWEETPEGTIALLLLLDMFPRRMFRGTPRAYATDDFALDIAREAIIRHFDDRIDRQYKLFFYLPFSHAEDEGDQRLALFYIRERTKEEAWIDLADRRCDIIQRFGRFPHRNAALGRESTPEELAFLEKEKA